MMTYEEFQNRSHFTLEELLAFSYGRLVGNPPPAFDARLPAPPFLMMDRIREIRADGKRGAVRAEQDVRLDAWYFQCHMPGDPVQPGCLCVDAIWQLLGFYCVWRGGLGAGRALGCEEIQFSGQIRPGNRVVTYEVEIRRFAILKNSGSSITIGDGRIHVDGETIMTVRSAKSGTFQGITYPDYPLPSANSRGGMMRKEE